MIQEINFDEIEEVKDYNDDGSLYSIAHLKNGLLHGTMYIFANGGKLLAETIEYKDDLLDGDWTVYDDNGKMLSRTRYRKSKKNGRSNIYKDGELIKSVRYKDDKAEGKAYIKTKTKVGKIVIQTIHFGKDADKKNNVDRIYSREGLKRGRYRIDILIHNSKEFIDEAKKTSNKFVDPIKECIRINYPKKIQIRR